MGGGRIRGGRNSRHGAGGGTRHGAGGGTRHGAGGGTRHGAGGGTRRLEARGTRGAPGAVSLGMAGRFPCHLCLAAFGTPPVKSGETGDKPGKAICHSPPMVPAGIGRDRDFGARRGRSGREGTASDSGHTGAAKRRQGPRVPTAAPGNAADCERDEAHRDRPPSGRIFKRFGGGDSSAAWGRRRLEHEERERGGGRR